MCSPRLAVRIREVSREGGSYADGLDDAIEKLTCDGRIV